MDIYRMQMIRSHAHSHRSKNAHTKCQPNSLKNKETNDKMSGAICLAVPEVNWDRMRSERKGYYLCSFPLAFVLRCDNKRARHSFRTSLTQTHNTGMWEAMVASTLGTNSLLFVPDSLTHSHSQHFTHSHCHGHVLFAKTLWRNLLSRK